MKMLLEVIILRLLWLVLVGWMKKVGVLVLVSVVVILWVICFDLLILEIMMWLW